MDLNTEQQMIFDAVIQSTKPFVFIQGKAGTGKSFLVKKIQQRHGCTILVPTNMAANYYKGCKVSTIYSFFYGEVDDYRNGFQEPAEYTGPRRTLGRTSIAETLQYVEHLIIDEISMVRADLFEMINKICQIAKGNQRPFGGIQIIVVGDMLQLPPVVSENSEEEDSVLLKYLQDTYGGIYFFNSKIIQSNLKNIDFYELKKSVRQQGDPAYEKLLDVLREPTDSKQVREALEKINERVVSPENLPTAREAIHIVTTNSKVEKINEQQLGLLPGEEQFCSAEFQVCKKNCTIEDGPAFTLKFDANCVPEAYNPQEYYALDVPSKFAPVLKYKIGSKVMFTRSLKEGRQPYRKERDFWTCPMDVDNGSEGIVREIWLDAIFVEPIQQDRHALIKVKREVEERPQLKYDEKTKKLKKIGTIQKTEQYPLKSGYAITVHKSQGQTYSQVIIDLSESGMFAPGQLYVALSRAENLQGLFLTKRLTTSDCKADVQLIGFLKQMRTGSNLPVISAELLEEEPLPEACQQFERTILESKLPQSAKDDMSALTKEYNSAYRNGKYQFAYSEMDRMLDKIEPCCADKTILGQIRKELQQNATRESCDNLLKRIGELGASLEGNPTPELFRTDHRMPVQQSDGPFVHKIKFDKSGQKGFTYEKLFAAYLRGATQITLTDTFVRDQHQFDNLREFINLLIKLNPNTKLQLKFITRDMHQAPRLLNIKQYCRDNHISFTFDYKDRDDIHARTIQTDTGWEITLDRGLDIWIEPPFGVEREPDQADRPCKGGSFIDYDRISAAA